MKVFRRYVHARSHRKSYALSIHADAYCGWIDLTWGRRNWWIEVEW